MAKTWLGILRHAEALHNVDSYFSEIEDNILTSLGRAQAIAGINVRDLELIITSPT